MKRSKPIPQAPMPFSTTVGNLPKRNIYRDLGIPESLHLPLGADRKSAGNTPDVLSEARRTVEADACFEEVRHKTPDQVDGDLMGFYRSDPLRVTKGHGFGLFAKSRIRGKEGLGKQSDDSPNLRSVISSETICDEGDQGCSEQNKQSRIDAFIQSLEGDEFILAPLPLYGERSVESSKEVIVYEKLSH